MAAELRGLTANFADAGTPTRAARSDAALKYTTAFPNGDPEVAMEEYGLSKSQIERNLAYAKRAQASQRLDALVAASKASAAPVFQFWRSVVADPIIEQFRSASAGLSKLVRDELEGFFGTLNLAKPEAVRNALLEFVPLLVSEYGAVAETLALDYYDELRAASGAAGVFRATAGATGIPTSAVEAKVRYLAGQLWTPDPASMLGGLLTATDKYVKQPGRDAIAFNAKREGARWARVPTGAKTCSWCLVLASRDAVYLSKQSAGDRRGTGKGDAFHGDCDCLLSASA